MVHCSADFELYIHFFSLQVPAGQTFLTNGCNNRFGVSGELFSLFGADLHRTLSICMIRQYVFSFSFDTAEPFTQSIVLLPASSTYN